MKKAAFIVILFLLTQLVCAGVAQLSGHAADPEIFGTTLSFGSIVLVALFRATGLVRRRFCPVAMPVRLGRSAEAVAGALLLAFALSLAGALAGLPDDGMTEVFDAMRHNPFCLLLLCVVGPFTEEIVFREGVMRQLMLRRLSPVWAAAVSGVVFGIVHGNAAQAFPAATLGFVFGLFYWRTGNVRLCAAAHILNNSFAVLLLFFPTADAAIQSWSPVCQAALAAVLAAMALALLADWWRGTRLPVKKERI